MRYLSNRGFTLIELIIVLFILGLASSIVLFTVARTQKKTMLDQEARKIHRMLGYARELSLMQRTPFFFVSDEETGTFWLEKDSAPYGKIISLPEDIMIGSGRITFLPKGNSYGGTVTITDKNKRGYIIEVDPATGIAEIFRLQPS